MMPSGSLEKKNLEELAHSALLPGDTAALIVSGDLPPASQIFGEVLLGARNAEAISAGDARNTWHVIIALLLMIAEINDSPRQTER